MKAINVINKVCQVLAILFSVTALVIFFTDFATIVSAGTSYTLSGAMLGFGGKLTAAGVTMEKSARLLLIFWLTVIAAVCGGLTFKSKGAKFASPAFGLASAIYMLVVRLSTPTRFVDAKPLKEVTSVTFSSNVWLLVIVLFLAFASATAHLFINDYIEVSSSKGKLTICQRVVRFFRDYKSEAKKIVWPSFRDVLKNTAIVLIMCAALGVFIWLIDLGLGKLLSLILGI